MSESLVLVDEKDREIGIEEKIKAHKEGKLHRAFSIFVFNSKGEMLITRRAKSKYHWSGFWSNACCSHPRPGEPLEKAAHRRLKEELGFDCGLKKAFDFIYKVKFENGLFEHEFDHVFIGKFDGKPSPDKEETDGWKWIPLGELKKEIADSAKYTPWFQIMVKKMQEMRTLN
ncbi:MAG: isopentenyl-diphosphate Delta-isomerase [Candidatus Aenigmarchaeota archaeon]|nr:isopentenyl-diphosphate Delta-isomerase [Candidatus Aenigmarchaeota archaeon]